MALAVTHVILVIVALDFFRHYILGKKKFPRYLIVLGGIAGLAPDLYVPLTWVYQFITGSSTSLHGLFTHTIFFPIFFLLVAGTLQFLQNKKWSSIFYVISFGWFFHLTLDCLYGGYKSFLWPLNVPTYFCPQWGISPYAVSIDAIILIIWLVHEEMHHYIKDYF